MSFWAISCFSRDTVAVPGTTTILERGSNVFNIVASDIHDTIRWLEDRGVRVNGCYKLSESPPDEVVDVSASARLNCRM